MIRMSLGLLVWVIFCALVQAKPVDLTLDTEASANKTFASSFVQLIRSAMESPEATIEIQTRSDWHIDYFEKQSTRWWQLISFHFGTYSPLFKRTVSGIAVTVFIYDPANNNAVIMTPEDAAAAIKRGRELNAVSRPSPGPGRDNGTI